ncbi:MAG: type II toxin-antitoxin system Phd/YefM family antitoxin [Oscillospiraceae bacterium]|mgnify:CR=1 FL=1|nr:type II toxin-antitoxin system Phd/YefM family antitoxin [Oscillospiraceae bacterium]
MTIKPSTALRNEYPKIASLAKETGEPIFITNKGEADGVYMSIEAYEEREKMLAHRASILAAEADRLAGGPTYTLEEVRAKLREKFADA